VKIIESVEDLCKSHFSVFWPYFFKLNYA